MSVEEYFQVIGQLGSNNLYGVIHIKNQFKIFYLCERWNWWDRIGQHIHFHLN